MKKSSRAIFNEQSGPLCAPTPEKMSQEKMEGILAVYQYSSWKNVNTDHNAQRVHIYIRQFGGLKSSTKFLNNPFICSILLKRGHQSRTCYYVRNVNAFTYGLKSNIFFCV